jgi:hypothetical protein
VRSSSQVKHRELKVLEVVKVVEDEEVFGHRGI